MRGVAISAHRGGGEVAPAGTLESYQDALAAGADYVEFDVHRTSDGALVVYHDKRAEKQGLDPARLTRTELCRRIGRDVLDARDLLAMMKGRAIAHIDVKAPGYEHAIAAAALEVLGPDAFIITGVDDVVKAVKHRFPQAPCALSVGRGWHEVPLSRVVQTRYSELHPLPRVRACGADAVAMHYVLARLGALANCSKAGIDAMVWTVNDSTMIRSFLRDPRVTVLVTDRPRHALAERDKTSRNAV